MGARVQLVVAHPDDETFGCGSLLLDCAEKGAMTAVCCATRGEAGEPRPGSGFSREGLGSVRERELHEAATLLEVSRVDVLGFVDSGMSGQPAPGSLVGAPLERVVDAVAGCLIAFRPDIVVTLDASDGHRDHARIRDATLTAAQALDVPRVYLQCLPRSLLQRWLERMQQARPDVEHLDADAAVLGTPDEDITTVIDTRSHLKVREQAIAAHRSQLSPFEDLPVDLREAFLTAEHLRRVIPPWIGGPRETHLAVPDPWRDAHAVPSVTPHSRL